MGSQFTQSPIIFCANLDPMSNPSWNFVPLDFSENMGSVVPNLTSAEFDEGLVVGSQLSENPFVFCVNWDPRPTLHGISYPHIGDNTAGGFS